MIHPSLVRFAGSGSDSEGRGMLRHLEFPASDRLIVQERACVARANLASLAANLAHDSTADSSTSALHSLKKRLLQPHRSRLCAALCRTTRAKCLESNRDPMKRNKQVRTRSVAAFKLVWCFVRAEVVEFEWRSDFTRVGAEFFNKQVRRAGLSPI